MSAYSCPLGAVLNRCEARDSNLEDDKGPSIAWENEAAVVYSTFIDDERWMKQQTYVGTVHACTRGTHRRVAEMYSIEDDEESVKLGEHYLFSQSEDLSTILNIRL